MFALALCTLRCQLAKLTASSPKVPHNGLVIGPLLPVYRTDERGASAIDTVAMLDAGAHIAQLLGLGASGCTSTDDIWVATTKVRLQERHALLVG